MATIETRALKTPVGVPRGSIGKDDQSHSLFSNPLDYNTMPPWLEQFLDPSLVSRISSILKHN